MPYAAVVMKNFNPNTTDSNVLSVRDNLASIRKAISTMVTREYANLKTVLSQMNESYLTTGGVELLLMLNRAITQTNGTYDPDTFTFCGKNDTYCIQNIYYLTSNINNHVITNGATMS